MSSSNKPASRHRSDRTTGKSTQSSHTNKSDAISKMPQATSEQIRMANMSANSDEESQMKTKLSEVQEIVPGIPEEDIIYALQQNDCCVSTTVAMLLETMDDSKFGEWQESGKKRGKKPKAPENETPAVEVNHAEMSKPSKSRGGKKGNVPRSRPKDNHEDSERQNNDRNRSDTGGKERGRGRGRGRGGSTRGRGFNRGGARSVNKISNASNDNSPKQEIGMWENGMDTKHTWEDDEWQGDLKDSKVFTPSVTAVSGKSMKNTGASGDFGGEFSTHQASQPDSKIVFDKEATENLKSVMGIGTNSAKPISAPNKRPGPQSAKVTQSAVEMPSGNPSASYNLGVSFGWRDGNEGTATTGGLTFGDIGSGPIINGSVSPAPQSRESPMKQPPVVTQTMFSSASKPETSDTRGFSSPSTTAYSTDPTIYAQTSTISSSYQTSNNSFSYAQTSSGTSEPSTAMANAVSKLNENLTKMSVDDGSASTSNRLHASRSSNGYMGATKLPPGVAMQPPLMNTGYLVGQPNAPTAGIPYYSNLHANQQVYNTAYDSNDLMQLQRMQTMQYYDMSFQPRGESSSQQFNTGAAATASEKLSRHDSQSPAMSTSASVPSSSHQQLQYMASSAIPPGYHHYYAPSAAAGYGPHLYSMYNTPNTFNAAPKQYSNYNSTSTTSTGGAGTGGVADHYGGSKSAYDKNFQSSTTPPYNLPHTHTQLDRKSVV